MDTNLREPLRLPASAIPDGTLHWRGEQVRRWTEALPPRQMSVRLRLLYVKLAVLCPWLAAYGLMSLADLPPYIAALLPLQAIWLVWRPEVMWYSAAALFTALAAYLSFVPASWWVFFPAALALAASVAPAEIRTRAGQRQQEAALAAAGGTTARLPDAGKPVLRGRFLIGAGTFLLVPGAVLVAVAHLFDDAVDRQGTTMTGVFVIGLGLTVLLSGVLGRRRARALRQAPAPVLRVLVREDTRGDAEVFAADDTTALRPLFTVVLTELDDSTDDDNDDDDDEDLEGLLDRLDDDRSGPLREAVLYGTPYDGAEILLVSAAPKPGEPPVTEWSTGPVRPLSERGVRRRIVREKRAVAQAARAEARHEELVGAVRAATVVGQVRRWRAGPVDWLATFLMVQWCAWFFWAGVDDSLWHRALLLLIGLMGAARVPVKLRWRITADRTGIWLNELRRPRHIPWDDVRSARRESFDLKVRWRGGDSWSVAAPRWAWLQRRRGLTHPYDALAAELSAMIADPALRPTGESGEKERGRPLWPFAVILGSGWIALLVARWLS